MKPLKLSFVLILPILGLTLNVPSLSANENLNARQSGPESQFNKPPVQKPPTSRKEPKTNQRGTKDNPLFVDVIKPPQTDKETTNEQKDHDEKLTLDMKTVALNEKTVELNSEVARFTGYLAGLALLQFLVLSLQVVFNYKQTKHQRIIERAYVFAHIKDFDADPDTPRHDIIYNSFTLLDVTVEFVNYGKTPAIVRLTQGKLMMTTTAPDKIPGDVETQYWQEGFVIAQGKSMTAHVTLSIPKDGMAQVIEGGISLYSLGVIQYRDVFGNQGETGFCWRYSHPSNTFRFVTDSPLNYYK